MSDNLSDSELHRLFSQSLGLIDGYARAVPYIQRDQIQQTREFINRFGMELYVQLLEKNFAGNLLSVVFALENDPQYNTPDLQRILRSPEFRAFFVKVDAILKSLEDQQFLKSGSESPLQRKAMTRDDFIAVVTARSIILNFAATFHYRTTLPELIRRAREGNRDSVLTLVRLDSTFLGADFVRNELLLAELAHDRYFKRKLSNALSPEPKGRTYNTKRKRFALTFLWSFGFQNRPDSDWSEFLKQHLGFKSLHDPFNVGRYRLRCGLGKRKTSKRH